MLYLINTLFFLIDSPTHHIHGCMTCFGLHDFEGVFFCVASTLRVHDVFMEGVFRSSVYYYYGDFLCGGQGLDVVWLD
jgi:hypothetical protein